MKITTCWWIIIFIYQNYRFLQDNHIINPHFQDITIIEVIEDQFNTNFDKGTFSRAITVKANAFEEIFVRNYPSCC